jgi:hypothetical protein
LSECLAETVRADPNARLAHSRSCRFGSEAELRPDHENRADSMAPVTRGLQGNGPFAQPATTGPTLIGCTSFFVLPRFPEVPFAYAASTVLTSAKRARISC